MSPLQVTVHAGKDLKQKGWYDKLDPFVSLTVGQDKQSGIKVKNAGDHALFGDTYTFSWNGEDCMEIVVKDEDLLKDDLVGKAVVSGAQLQHSSWHGWIEIERKGQVTGRLLITTVHLDF